MIRSDLEVVLCTYNGASFVEEQVRSILRQNVLPSVISVWDDGSTDGTVDRIRREFDHRPAPAIEIALRVTGPGGTRGASQNFDRGMRAADREYVALADQDDIWHTDRLERTVSILDDKPNIALVASNAQIIDRHGAATGTSVFDHQEITADEARRLANGDSFDVLLRRNVAPGMTFTFRRSFLQSLGGLPPGALHDYWLAVSAGFEGKFLVLPERLVSYRLHGNNAIGLDNGGASIRKKAEVWRHIRETPLSDLNQWLSLVRDNESDTQDERSVAVAQRIEFERQRRYPDLRGRARVLAFLRLLRSDQYNRYTLGTRRDALKDFLRPAASDDRQSSGRWSEQSQ